MNIANKDRCAYRSPSGRRCRNDAHYAWNMCHKHCDFAKAQAAADEIVSNKDRLDTAEGIHSMMARVLRALAAGKIRTRDASTLLYGGQTMLFSLTHLHEERKKLFLVEEDEAWRRKALADSYHDALNCEESSKEEDGEEDTEEQEAATAKTKTK
jgi:hypothetical protein